MTFLLLEDQLEEEEEGSSNNHHRNSNDTRRYPFDEEVEDCWGATPPMWPRRSCDTRSQRRITWACKEVVEGTSTT